MGPKSPLPPRNTGYLTYWLTPSLQPLLRRGAQTLGVAALLSYARIDSQTELAPA